MAGGKKNKYGQTTGKGRPPKSGAPRALVLVCAVLAAGAAAASYANSLSGGFFFDNYVLIHENPMVSEPAMAGKIFASHYWAPLGDSILYRPLTIWTYHVQHPGTPESRAQNYALDPLPYHVFNLVLHALNALLAFAALLFILRKVLVEDRWNVVAAGFGAVLFAAHPITTEAVTNIVGRADLLVMLFLLLGLLSHMRGGERSGIRALPYHAFAAVSMALGLLSKENAIAIIAVFFLYDLLFLRPRRPGKGAFAGWLLGRLGACYAMYLFVIAAWLFARYLALHDLQVFRAPYVDNPLIYMPFFQREATAIVMLGLYLWRMLWPMTLSADYSAEQIQAVQSVFDPRLLGSAAAIIAVAAVAALMRRRYPPATFLIFFFLVTIFPVSNIVVLTGTIGAERLLYVSSLGWAGCLALGGVQLARVFGRKIGRPGAAVPLALLGVIAVLYGARTHERNKDWEDDLTFWRATAAASDRSVRALQNYARVLCRRSEPEVLGEGRRLLERALDISECYVPVHATLGWIYNASARNALIAGNYRRARECYERGYEVMKRGRRMDQTLIRTAQDDLAASGIQMRQTLSSTWQLYDTLGKTCVGLADFAQADGDMEGYAGYLEEARENFRFALPLQNHDPAWHREYGRLLARLAELSAGDRRKDMYEEAVVSLWRAIILSASGINAWEDLIRCYAALGRGQDLIVESGTGFTYKKGENENRLYQVRAFRSLIMTLRVLGLEDAASEVARLAAQQYGIPRSALETAFRGEFTVNDPVILTGE